MRTVVAGVVPKLIPIHSILDLTDGPVIQGSADQVNDPAIGQGIKPNGDLFLALNGFEELVVVWYHKVNVLE